MKGYTLRIDDKILTLGTVTPRSYDVWWKADCGRHLIYSLAIAALAALAQGSGLHRHQAADSLIVSSLGNYQGANH